jgi:hypothetical protein
MEEAGLVETENFTLRNIMGLSHVLSCLNHTLLAQTEQLFIKGMESMIN